MFRNMLVSLLQHERIRTTLAKAKELRSWAEKMITLGKKDNLHARRQAFSLLRNREMVKKLFEEIVPKLKDREGGYTRIYKMGWRQGDGAPLSLIELITFSPPEEKKKSAVKKALEKVTPKRKKKAEGKDKKERKEGKEKKEKAKEPSAKGAKKKPSEEKSE